MGPELIRNGSFENLAAPFVGDKTDPGTMTLAPGTNELKDWSVPNGPIGVMNNKTMRVPSPYSIGPPGPDAGQYFLDLTGNGARPNGGISQFIETHPGWYQVSLALGMNDATNATGGPVAVDVVFFSLANHLIGLTWFHMDRGSGRSSRMRSLWETIQAPSRRSTKRLSIFWPGYTINIRTRARL
jgi:hypothetical protein